MVPLAGLEPARLSTGDFESPMYTNFITAAYFFLKKLNILMREAATKESSQSALLISNKKEILEELINRGKFYLEADKKCTSYN